MTRADEPVLITTAPPSPAEERRGRERRYLITMGIRVVCFILSIVLFGLRMPFLGGFAIAASLILPWVAVVAANAPKRAAPTAPSLYAARKVAELEAGPRPDDQR